MPVRRPHKAGAMRAMGRHTAGRRALISRTHSAGMMVCKDHGATGAQKALHHGRAQQLYNAASDDVPTAPCDVHTVRPPHPSAHTHTIRAGGRAHLPIDPPPADRPVGDTPPSCSFQTHSAAPAAHGAGPAAAPGSPTMQGPCIQRAAAARRQRRSGPAGVRCVRCARAARAYVHAYMCARRTEGGAGVTRYMLTYWQATAEYLMAQGCRSAALQAVGEGGGMEPNETRF